MTDPSGAYLTPEARARMEIDRRLVEAGWAVQDTSRVNLGAARGVAVREFVMAPPHGRADYLLFLDGQAAGVVPDNVLFEGGAGETVRRRLLQECDVHTLLRLPTGVFYAQGVKANVLFFDRKPAAELPWTRDLWVYDLRTNMHFTLKQNPLRRDHLQDFVDVYKADDRRRREESERFHRLMYDELMARDKASLDLIWLRDESLEDSDNLPPPEVIAQEILEDLEAALAEFSAIAANLTPQPEEQDN
jgi:type I restriction enzyme M protein